jgi:hypothetical protein
MRGYVIVGWFVVPAVAYLPREGRRQLRRPSGKHGDCSCPDQDSQADNGYAEIKIGHGTPQTRA